MRVYVVVGGQFGSEAKGHVSAQLAARELSRDRQVAAVRVAGPNAGHTAYDKDGRAFALRTIPAMAVVDDSVQLVLAAGSELDPTVLLDEINWLEKSGIHISDRLWIDSQATVLGPEHIQSETDATMHERLGSTGKGVGAARADRIMRKALTWEQYLASGDAHSILESIDSMDTSHWLASRGQDTSVIIEGTQGFGLGLHAGYYPYCTSSDCRAIDFLAMAGIDPRDSKITRCESVVTLRTFPIRVAGNSGPMHDETDWETLGAETGGHIKPERTTVTKKVRRVGRWDTELAHRAILANGGPESCIVALTFLDYIDPVVYGATEPMHLTEPAVDFIKDVGQQLGRRVQLVTTGPETAVWL